MNSSWWWLVIWASVAGAFVGFAAGYWYRYRGDARRAEERRLSEISRKKGMLQRNGRRLPRREGAGAPIVVRKASIRRSRQMH